MKIDFQIIPHNQQRYNTVGDYWRETLDEWHFRVSAMDDGRYHWLVFIHELIEAGYCYMRGIPWTEIDAFDMTYEDARKFGQKRAPCGCKFQNEPGFDKHAPYHKGHKLADKCERLLAHALHVQWKEYNKEVESLG